MQKNIDRTQGSLNAPDIHEVLIEGFFTLARAVQEMHIGLAQQGLVPHRLPFEPSAVTDIATAREYTTRRLLQVDDIRKAICHNLLGKAERKETPTEGSAVRIPFASTRAYSADSVRKFSEEVLTDAAKLRELLFMQVSLLRGKELPPCEALLVDGEVRVFPDTAYLAKLMQSTAFGNRSQEGNVIDLKILRSQSFSITLSGDSGMTLQQAVDSALATDRKFLRITGAVSVTEAITVSTRGELLVIEGVGKFASIRASARCFSVVSGARVLLRNLRISSESDCAVFTRGNADVRLERCNVTGEVGISATEASRVLMRVSEISRCSQAAISSSDAAVVEVEMSKIIAGEEGVVAVGTSFVTVSDSTFSDIMGSALRAQSNATAKILHSKISNCGGTSSAITVQGTAGLASSGTEISGGRGWGFVAAEEGKFELVNMRIDGNSGSAKISGGSVAGVFRKFVDCRFDSAVEISSESKVVAHGCSKELPAAEPRLDLKEYSR